MGLGIMSGDALADARAINPGLVTAQATPAADRARLRSLACWLGRFGVSRNSYDFTREGASGCPVRCYGLWVDISGVAHLYGGELALLSDLDRRLSRFGLTSGLGLADTFGAAHAIAWYRGAGEGERVASPREEQIAPAGSPAEAIFPLPVAALRLDGESVQLLRRLGFKTIGDLAGVPRVALERRFRSRDVRARVLLRLDQALGVRAEPRRPLVEQPAMSVEAVFAEPLISSDGLLAESGVLVERLCCRLKEAALGVRALQLTLYRSDGSIASAAVGTSRPAQDGAHLMRLLSEKIAGLDMGFGVDVLVLEASRAEPVQSEQGALTSRGEATNGNVDDDAEAHLVDRLVARLGGARVTRMVPIASHWPERCEIMLPALSQLGAPQPDPLRLTSWRVPGRSLRPALLLASPEPIGVIAEVPEGAPLRFTWRRASYRIVRSAGPERIEPEWWREIGIEEARHTRPRDYYRIEDAAGVRFWVFRVGRYAGEGGDACSGAPAWFIHGLFA